MKVVDAHGRIEDQASLYREIYDRVDPYETLEVSKRFSKVKRITWAIRDNSLWELGYDSTGAGL